MRVTNGIPLGCTLLLPVGTAICVHTLKSYSRSDCYSTLTSTLTLTLTLTLKVVRPLRSTKG
jgi:hypothetical protein